MEKVACLLDNSEATSKAFIIKFAFFKVFLDIKLSCSKRENTLFRLFEYIERVF